MKNIANYLFGLSIVVGLAACDDVLDRTDRDRVDDCATCVEGVDTSFISAEYNFDSNFVSVDGVQLHYVDEPGEGEYTFVLIHGLPTWSYLWRNMIPHLQNRGRVVAIDLIGHGKSDKPNIEYTINNVADYAIEQLEQLSLGDNIILVMQDWGGPVGFEFARRYPDRVRGMAFFETIWAPVPSFDAFPPDFADFQRFIRTGEEGDNTPGSSWDVMVNQQFILETLIPDLTLRDLTAEEMNQYRAPFAEVDERKAMWQLPQQVPIEGDPAEAQAFFESLQAFMTTTPIPKYMPHGNPGFNVSEADYELWTELLPNASHEAVGPGLHFVQEDIPHELGVAVKAWTDQL